MCSLDCQKNLGCCVKWAQEPTASQLFGCMCVWERVWRLLFCNHALVSVARLYRSFTQLLFSGKFLQVRSAFRRWQVVHFLSIPTTCANVHVGSVWLGFCSWRNSSASPRGGVAFKTSRWLIGNKGKTLLSWSSVEWSQNITDDILRQQLKHLNTSIKRTEFKHLNSLIFMNEENVCIFF